MRLILKRIHSKPWEIKTWPLKIVLEWNDSGAVNSRLDRDQTCGLYQTLMNLKLSKDFTQEIGRLKSMKKKVRDMETRLNGSNICLVRVPKVKGKRNREAI